MSLGEKILKGLIQLENDYPPNPPPPEKNNHIQIAEGKHNCQAFICLIHMHPVPEILHEYLYWKHLYCFLLVSSTSVLPMEVTVFSLSSLK